MLPAVLRGEEAERRAAIVNMQGMIYHLFHCWRPKKAVYPNWTNDSHD
jgi:hypothetical protein